MNDMISRKAAIEALGKEGLITAMVIIDRMPSAQPVARDINVPTNNCINRQEAIDQLHQSYNLFDAERRLEDLPPAQPEPLTDKEQRLFLAAMRREEKVCEEVDRNYMREPYEDSLMRVCKEIRRKVKSALWT